MRQVRDDLGTGLAHGLLGEHFRRIDEVAFEVVHLDGHRHFRAAEHEGLAALGCHLRERLVHGRRVVAHIARLDAVIDHAVDGFLCLALRLDDLEGFYAVCLAAGIEEKTEGFPRLHPPGDKKIMAALIDPDGTLLRLIRN